MSGHHRNPPPHIDTRGPRTAAVRPPIVRARSSIAEETRPADVIREPVIFVVEVVSVAVTIR